MDICPQCHRVVHKVSAERIEYGVRTVFHKPCLLTYLADINAYKKANEELKPTGFIQRFFQRLR